MLNIKTIYKTEDNRSFDNLVDAEIHAAKIHSGKFTDEKDLKRFLTIHYRELFSEIEVVYDPYSYQDLISTHIQKDTRKIYLSDKLLEKQELEKIVLDMTLEEASTRMFNITKKQFMIATEILKNYKAEVDAIELQYLLTNIDLFITTGKGNSAKEKLPNIDEV